MKLLYTASGELRQRIRPIGQVSALKSAIAPKPTREAPRVYAPMAAVASFLKSLTTATVVSQLHFIAATNQPTDYLEAYTEEGELRRWFAYTYEQLRSQHFPGVLTTREIADIIRYLEDIGWLYSDQSLNNTLLYRRKWYLLNYEKIEADCGCKLPWYASKNPWIMQSLGLVDRSYIYKINKQQLGKKDLQEDFEGSGNYPEANNKETPKPEFDRDTKIYIEEEQETDCEIEELAESEENQEKVAYLKQIGLYSYEILQQVLKMSLEELNKAVELVTQRAKTRPIDNLKGYLYLCIKRQWYKEEQLTEAALQPKPVEITPPEGFEEWFKLAKEAKIIAWHSQIDKLTRIAGEFIVDVIAGVSHGRSDAWRLSSAMREYPIEKLRLGIP